MLRNIKKDSKINYFVHKPHQKTDQCYLTGCSFSRSRVLGCEVFDNVVLTFEMEH